MRRLLSRKVIIVAFIGLMVVTALVAWRLQRASPANTPAAPESTTEQATGGFDKQQFSLDDPASPWVVVNKHRPLQPRDYTPTDVVIPNVTLRVPGHESMQIRKEAATAIEQLFADAQQAGLQLMLASGYRSYQYQVGLYDGYVRTEGVAVADTQSARPGYSEHQLGWGVDVEPASRACELDECFATTPEGKWVAENAHQYGFIIRYPNDKIAVTGYAYEPWHLRYVGTSLATEMHAQGIETLEEFFGLEPAPTYN